MVFTRIQVKILISQINNLNINQQVHMAAPVNYVLSPFEGNINPGDPQGIKPYIRGTKEIDKEDDKLDSSVSNSKGIIDNFLSIAKTICLGTPCIHGRY